MNQQSHALGPILKEWRALRGVSQLDLANRSEVSARHISFVETGRSTPSRQMVMTLCEALDMPLRDRNRALVAAGYAPQFPDSGILAEGIAGDEARRVVQHILDMHDPCPAFAIDAGWNMVSANQAGLIVASKLLDPSLLAPEDGVVNLIHTMFDDGGLKRHIGNWPVVVTGMVSRLRREVEAHGRSGGAGEKLYDLWQMAERERKRIAGGQSPTGTGLDEHPLMIPIDLMMDGELVRCATTITTLGTPNDVLLEELRIEAFLPLDDAGKKVLTRFATAQ